MIRLSRSVYIASLSGLHHATCFHRSPVFNGRVCVPPFFRAHLFTTSQMLTQLPDAPVLPEPPLPPVSELVLNSLGEPTFASLGLNSYWPSGWYQAVLESLHVSFGLPWWSAIAASTVLIRLFIFPFMIRERRRLAAYTTAMPQLTLLQERLTAARLSGNYVEVLRVSKEIEEFVKTNDVNPLNSMRLFFIQAPIFLSVFTGLRGMAVLPVASMKSGGLSWFADLTVADPYYILPVISMTSVLIMFEVGVETSSASVAPSVKLMLRAFPVVGFFMILNMPSALLWYWTVSNFISLSQAQILRIPAVRDYFKLPIPKPVPGNAAKKRGFVEGFRESMANSRLIAELETRERADAKAWLQSGRKLAPKTYAFDPTKRNYSPSQTVVPVTGKIVTSGHNQTAKNCT